LKKEEAKAQETAKEGKLIEEATLGGGCFWCTEAIIEELEGVNEVVSGYAGGETENPTYHQVSHGTTGHAEVTQVYFDPQVISYADLLRVFLATHNPTTLNRQGVDVGEEYRSIILYHNEQQQQTAREIIQEMQPLFDKPIVTDVVPFTKFYKAEQSHQDYYRSNPEKAYCQAVINPKLQKMRLQFTNSLKKKKTIHQD
jgi:peptide-methionine (S)-S-oxide reductase